MPPKNIVIGQKISSAKVARAKELRQAMTVEEQILWKHLRTNHLEGWHFRRQQVIAGFIVDFYCHAVNLVIELDGPIHISQVEADKERDHSLSEMGFRVLRFQNQQINENLEDVLKSILQACAEMKKT